MSEKIEICESVTISDGESGSTSILLSNKKTSIDAILGLLGIYDMGPNTATNNTSKILTLTFFREGETRSENIVVSSAVGVEGLAKYIKKMTTPRMTTPR